MDEELKNREKISVIYWTMFRIGCLTYGGGWSIFAQLEEEFGDRRGWISREDLLDIMSLARSFPGIMVINMSVLFGYRVLGVPGAVAAAFGLSTPAFFVISLVTLCYDAMIKNIWIARAMVGVRCSVVPIILMAAMRMKKKALTGRAACVLAAVSFLLCIFTKLNKLVMVIAAGILGLLFWGKKTEAGGEDHDIA